MNVYGQITDASTKFEQHELLTLLNFEGNDYSQYATNFESTFETVSKFYDVPTDLVIIQYFSKELRPQYSFHAKPELSVEFQNKLDSAFSSIDPVFTTITNFQTTFRCKLNGGNKNRKAVYTPAIPKLRNLPRESYKNEPIQSLVAQTKNWAAEVAMPLLQLHLQNYEYVSPEIAVFANDLDLLLKDTTLSVEEKFDSNPIYWLANEQLKEAPTLLPTIKLFALVMDGRFEFAQTYAQIMYNFSAQESIIIYLLTELSWRSSYCAQKQETMSRKAIQFKNDNLLDSANNVMTNLFESNVKSAYGFAKFANFNFDSLNLKSQENIFEDESNSSYLFKLNPFSIDTIPASNKVEAYQNQIRLIIYDYFVDPRRIEGDYERFANRALELKSYSIAAELFRLLSNKSNLTEVEENAYIEKYLFSLHMLKIQSVDKIYEIKSKRRDKKLKKALKKTMIKNDRYKNFDK